MVSDMEVSWVLSLLLARSLSSCAFSFYTLSQFFLSSQEMGIFKNNFKSITRVWMCVHLCTDIPLYVAAPTEVRNREPHSLELEWQPVMGHLT